MTFYVSNEDRLWNEPQQKGWFRFPSPIRFIVFLILLVCCIVVVWYFFLSSRRMPQIAELPIVRAEETPFKMKAEDKGVPGINHQDKLVYGRIRNDEQVPPVEHILPDPEPPLAGLKEPSGPIQMVEQYTPEDVVLEKVTEVVSAPSKPAVPAIDSIEALIAKTAPEEKLISEEKPISSKKGKVLIQLGSLKSHDLAESEWSRLSKKHKDVLGGFDPVIQKVDLGEEKGIYHRLRTGPFETTEKAQKACAALKEKKVECRVISQ